MNRIKFVLIAILLIFISATAVIIYILSTAGIESKYLQRNLSNQINNSNYTVNLSKVKIKLLKQQGLVIEIPSLEVISNKNFLATDITVDFNLLNILYKGVALANFELSSDINFNDQNFNLSIESNPDHYVVKKLSNESISLIDSIIIPKNEINIFEIKFEFTSKFIKKNFNKFIVDIDSKYSLDSLDILFDESLKYTADIQLNLDNQELFVRKIENKLKINPVTKINFANIYDIKTHIEMSLPTSDILSIVKNFSSYRNSNDTRFFNILSNVLHEDQLLVFDFNLINLLELSNVKLQLDGKTKFDYILDDNANPSFLKGNAPYNLTLIKDNQNDQIYSISAGIDLSKIESFIRQVNFKKNINDILSFEVTSNLNLKDDIDFKLSSKNPNDINFRGKITLSKNNDLIVDNLYVSNKNNVDLTINAKLTNRDLIMSVIGETLDLSKNVININDKNREYYFNSESYVISANNAFLSDGLIVDSFSGSIKKVKNQIKVAFRGDTLDSNFIYEREKNTKNDKTKIELSNLIDSVGPNHPARKIISKGEASIYSYRDIGSLSTNVNIDLKDFILINSPSTLKLLSLPSFSGLSAVLSDESGIQFDHGQLNYDVDKFMYSNINAFGINDGIGLILSGNIDRINKTMDLTGQVSPLQLISGIIQKIPLIGNIFIGDEGDGILAVEFNMTGNQDHPDVKSNPLSIFKPRIFQRTIDFLNKNIIN